MSEFNGDITTRMSVSGIDNLGIRLGYAGGARQESRFINDKLKTLKKALLYSYQAETITLPPKEGEEIGREFRCLINPNKKSTDYDSKILSIPFEDICLNKDMLGKTSEGIEKIGLKGGDVFYWNRMDSRWIIYLEHSEEEAYFRADIRRCHETPITVNDKQYYFYLRGPSESDIDWLTDNHFNANDLNYSLVMYVPKDENTLSFFHRFALVTIDGNRWQVEAANPYGGDGIIIVHLSEYFNNKYEDKKKEEEKPSDTLIEEPGYPRIIGDSKIRPYDIKSYRIENANGGVWSIENPADKKTQARIISITGDTVTIEVITGKKGAFNLIYKTIDDESIILPITINSL